MPVTLIILLTTLLQISIDDPNKFNGFLVLGYFVMWVIGVVYVVSLSSRQRNMQRDIQLMQQILQEEDEAAEK